SYFSVEDNGRRFRAVAYPAATGIAPSYSNVFTFELIMKGYFPNAFSPNGDGANDDFKILGKFVEQASLRIYNRWGEELFYSVDKDKGWDGTYRGKPQPAGYYAYKAEVTTVDEKRSVMSGTVFLKR
ncbi:MAG: gliding motility-associated C-terminal domain-containing protein, partial [Bacteroidetes bacterium]|nr:gliding motility-associated C-terminal domain-containing protein [Bacteroidota bacterium]